MMLAHVVGAESGAIVEFDQLQPVFVLFAERIWPVVVLIEYPELHCTTHPKRFPAPAVRDLRPAGASASELSDTTIRDQVDTGSGCRRRPGRYFSASSFAVLPSTTLKTT